MKIKLAEISLSLIEALRIKYQSETWRIKVLVSICGVILATITSEEVWMLGDAFKDPKISNNFMLIYVTCFFILIFSVQYWDSFEIIKSKKNAVRMGLLTALVDIILVCGIEYLFISGLNVITDKPFGELRGALIISLPFILGATTLTNITVEILKRKEKKLKEEISVLEHRIKDQYDSQKRLQEKVDDLVLKQKDLEKKHNK